MTTNHAFVLIALLATVACGDDAASVPDASPPDATAPDADPLGCHVRLAAGADDQTTVQTALIENTAGHTICFEAGTYTFTDELSVTAAGVTLRGIGADRDAVIFDFAGQTSGANGLRVTGDDFTLESLTILSSPGDGARFQDITGLTVRDVRVEWTGGPMTTNGAYGLYPVGCKNVLIEDSEVIGASDAGIYVGQSETIIVRRNKVHGNVAGIEIENSTDAEVHDNHAYDNTGGIIVFALPNLPVKSCRRTIVRDNLLEHNNEMNFADPAGFVANVPPGVGVLILAADQVEVHSNTITGHDSSGVTAVSYDILVQFLGLTINDPGYDSFAQSIWVHDNTFTNNGTEPHTLFRAFGIPIEDIFWDGFVDPDKDNSDGHLSFCISDNGDASFRMGDAPGMQANATSDPADYTCTLEPLPAVQF